MVDWNDGKPNPRFRVLKLLHDNFAPGDKLVGLHGDVFSRNPYIYALPVIAKNGKQRILLVNKRDRPIQVTIARASGGQLEFVDQTTGFQPARKVRLKDNSVPLNGFSVAVVTLP